MRLLQPVGEIGASSKVARARQAESKVELPHALSAVATAAASCSGDLKSGIDEIERLSLDDLRLRWRNATGRLAPAHLSRALLARLLAYRLQARAFGDLDQKSVRALQRWSESLGSAANKDDSDSNAVTEPAQGPSATKRRASEPLILRPGTLLTREWNGRMETVMVVADGFAWNGRTFASLSAVARAITGTKWNGHRFFGVRSEDRAAHSGKGAPVPSDLTNRQDGAAGSRSGPTPGRPPGKAVGAPFAGEAPR